MPRSPHNRGFTLVELMISIAIALLLILGINVVFKTTAQTVGAGTSALSAARDARTVMATLLADLNQCLPPPTPSTPSGTAPCFIIRSEHTYAFRNATDREGAADPSAPATGPRPFVDSNLFQYVGFDQGSVNGAGSFTCPVPFVHFRSHRIDKLGFFATGVYPRQTSSDNYSFVSPTTTREAWVFYGHVMQPCNPMIAHPLKSDSQHPKSPNDYYGPGDLDGAGTKNDNNAVSADWILGRQTILMNGSVDTSIDPDYLMDPIAKAPSNNGLSPLTATTTSYSGLFTLMQSRLDMANVSISPNGNGYSSPSRSHGLYQDFQPGWLANPLYSDPANYWYEQLIGYRNQASGYLMFDPNAPATTGVPKITPYGLAQASGSVIRGCSQFIVEYAGNYYTKNQDGSAVDTLGVDAYGNKNIHMPIPDPKGTLDFYQYPLYPTGNPLAATSPMIRQTRWYGFPRSVNPSTTGLPNVAPNYGDVVPLRDVLASLSPPESTTKVYWWMSSTSQPTPLAPKSPTYFNFADAERFSTSWSTLINYATVTAQTGYPPTLAYSPARWNFNKPPTNAAATTGFNYWQKMAATADAPVAPPYPSVSSSPKYLYTAAWGPDVQYQGFPKLIRITIAMDDHEGRLSQPRLFEFIYQVSP